MAVTANAISGPYHSTWNGTYLGATEDGYEVEHTFYSEPIRGDNLGDAIQDEIHRGCDVYVNFTCIEWSKAVGAAGPAGGPISWPQAASRAAGVIGDVLSDGAGALVLTATANTPSAASPATMSFTKATLARNFPVRVVYASRLRRLPLRMIAYPQSAGSAAAQSYNAAINWYTTT